MSFDGAPSLDGNGRLEMFRGGVWGPVCSDGFSVGTAAVACKQMGFSGGAPLAPLACSSLIGLSHCCPMPPHVSELTRAGDEPNVISCPFAEGEDFFCAATEAVVLSCAGAGDAQGRPNKLPAPHVD